MPKKREKRRTKSSTNGSRNHRSTQEVDAFRMVSKTAPVSRSKSKNKSSRARNPSSRDRKFGIGEFEEKNKRNTSNASENDYQIVEIVDDFTELATSNEFSEKYKSNPKLQKKIQSLMTLFSTWSKAAGVTEYSAVDGGYKGDEFLEKYKDNVRMSWKDKSEKKNAVKEITNEEISSGHQGYLARRLALTHKREQQRIKGGQSSRKLIKDETTGQRVYIKLEQEIEYDSSDEDDDLITNRILGDRRAIPAHRKVSSYKRIQKYEEIEDEEESANSSADASSNSSDESSDDYSSDDDEQIIINVRENVRGTSRNVRGTSRKERENVRGNTRKDRLNKLSDVHNYHMSMLMGSSDEELN